MLRRIFSAITQTRYLTPHATGSLITRKDVACSGSFALPYYQMWCFFWMLSSYVSIAIGDLTDIRWGFEVMSSFDYTGGGRRNSGKERRTGVNTAVGSSPRHHSCAAHGRTRSLETRQQKRTLLIATLRTLHSRDSHIWGNEANHLQILLFHKAQWICGCHIALPNHSNQSRAFFSFGSPLSKLQCQWSRCSL
jgi:hypothetical protein